MEIVYFSPLRHLCNFYRSLNDVTWIFFIGGTFKDTTCHGKEIYFNLVTLVMLEQGENPFLRAARASQKPATKLSLLCRATDFTSPFFAPLATTIAAAGIVWGEYLANHGK